MKPSERGTVVQLFKFIVLFDERRRGKGRRRRGGGRGGGGKPLAGVLRVSLTEVY